jgi:hypothetical protein
VEAKIMVNDFMKIIFSLTIKISLIFASTFVKIHYRRALEFIGSPTLPSKIPEFWYPIAGIRRQRPNIAGFRFTPLVIFSNEQNAKKKKFKKIIFSEN